MLPRVPTRKLAHLLLVRQLTGRGEGRVAVADAELQQDRLRGHERLDVPRLAGVVGHEVDGVEDRPLDHVVDEFIEHCAIGDHPAARERSERSCTDVPRREPSTARDRSCVGIHERHLREQITVKVSDRRRLKARRIAMPQQERVDDAEFGAHPLLPLRLVEVGGLARSPLRPGERVDVMQVVGARLATRVLTPPWADPRARRGRSATVPAGAGDRRQGIPVQGEPRLAARARDRGDDPRT